jgi:SAM-dependent methyltransferase
MPRLPDDHAVRTYDIVAPIYDGIRPYDDDARAAVDFLAARAGRGPVLELGVGTGRIGLPLAARGHRVVGVDASAAMLDALVRKRTGTYPAVVRGDMARPPVRGGFPLVYCTDSGLFALLDPRAQRSCMERAVGLLAPGGLLVLETAIPGSIPAGVEPRVAGGVADPAHASLQLSRHDPMHSTVEFRHLWLGSGAARVLPAVMHYLTPSQLDLLGRLAGATLAGRYGDWRLGDLGPGSTRCVSVYRATIP